MTSEIINDLSAMSTIYASGRLWGSQVSEGFYYPGFSTYDQDPSKLPFGEVTLSIVHSTLLTNSVAVMIQQAIQTIAASEAATSVTHVTV